MKGRIVLATHGGKAISTRLPHGLQFHGNPTGVDTRLAQHCLVRARTALLYGNLCLGGNPNSLTKQNNDPDFLFQWLVELSLDMPLYQQFCDGMALPLAELRETADLIKASALEYGGSFAELKKTSRIM